MTANILRPDLFSGLCGEGDRRVHYKVRSRYTYTVPMPSTTTLSVKCRRVRNRSDEDSAGIFFLGLRCERKFACLSWREYYHELIMGSRHFLFIYLFI